MGGMTALVELFITNNKLRQLPASMASLTSLVKLQVLLRHPRFWSQQQRHGHTARVSLHL